MLEARTQLRCHPSCAGAARSFVADTLASWGCASFIESPLDLLTSEVVTNAFLHGLVPIGLCLSLLRGGEGLAVRVEVSDSGSRDPVVGSPRDDEERGRGMLLVQALARRWGVDPFDAGKAVWFELGEP